MGWGDPTSAEMCHGALNLLVREDLREYAWYTCCAVELEAVPAHPVSERNRSRRPLASPYGVPSAGARHRRRGGSRIGLHPDCDAVSLEGGGKPRQAPPRCIAARTSDSASDDGGPRRRWDAERHCATAGGRRGGGVLCLGGIRTPNFGFGLR